MRIVTNRLGELRMQAGRSAVELAGAAGVSRQTIHAIEAGSYVPNTAVALQLARILDTTVEELFSLPAAQQTEERITALPGREPPLPGQPVQICRVDRKLFAEATSPVPCFLPESDGVMSGTPSKAHVFNEGALSENRILMAGCDPGMTILLRHVARAGIELVAAHRNSSQALELLQQGAVHIAGTHLHGVLRGRTMEVVCLATWEQGIVTAAGNPKNIRGIEDLSRSDVTIVNREKGAGARVLLDASLKKAGIRSAQVRGYANNAAGHLPAAWKVQSGAADYCIATRAAARAFGLGFISLVTERYDLAIQKKHMKLPGIQAIFDAMTRSGFRRELESLGGYDTSMTGSRSVP